VAAISGEPRHREVASLFDKPCALGTLAADEDPFVGIHANTNVPILLGGATRHEVTGETGLRLAVSNFFSLIVSTRSFAAGGSTHGEIWGAPLQLGATLGPGPVGTEHQESCVTHNMLKIAAKLLRWSADYQFADFTERALLNSVLGTMRGDEPGALLYTLPLGAGVSKRDHQAWRTSERGGWAHEHSDLWCCSGTGIEAFAKLPEHVFARRVAPSAVPELDVLQYLPTTLTWPAAGARVDLDATDLSRAPPGEPLALSLRVAPTGGDAVRLSLVVRIAPWAWDGEPPSATLNGEPLRIEANASQLRLSRAWTAADVLRLRLWPTIRLEPAPDTRAPYAGLRAVFYGPLLLAGLAHESGVRRLRVGLSESPAAWLVPLPAEARKQYVSVREQVLGAGGAPARAWVHAQGRLQLRAVEAAPPSERPFGGGGTNASAAATWRLQLAGEWGPAGAVLLEAYDRPGDFVAPSADGAPLLLRSQPAAFWLRKPLSGAPGATSFESVAQPGSYVSELPRSAAVGAEPPSLGLARGDASDAAFARVSSFRVGNATEAPPPLAFWARPRAGAGGGFLMYALNEVLDERYSVYLELDR